jgi:hypothetical protein
MAANVKATAIHLASEEIATAIHGQSVEAIANRCWRKNIISEQVYKQILRPHPSIDPVRVLLEAVEASIREEEAHFGEFLEILGNELQPQAYKDVESQITYHLEEARERTKLAQCTEDDTQNESNEIEVVAETTDTQSAQVSDSNLLIAGTNEDTSCSSSILRKRKRDGTCAHSSPRTDEKSSVLCEQPQDTHTGTHGFPGSSILEPFQATCTKETPNNSDVNLPRSNEVEPIQATVDTTPSLLDHSLQQRQETLRLQEEKFSKYDKLQAEANNQVLTDENKDLKRQLGQQSGDLNHTCEEKKRLEKELSDKRLKIDQLLVERSQRIEHHQYALEQLQNRVAEDEKERNELEVKRRELEQTIEEITEAYDSEISQCRCEIAALQEKLDAMKAVVDNQSNTIYEQRHEIRRLSSNVIELHVKFDEFKRDARALMVFLVVFVILIGVIQTLVLIVGLFKSLF